MNKHPYFYDRKREQHEDREEEIKAEVRRHLAEPRRRITGRVLADLRKSPITN